MRVVQVIPSLSVGGAERVAAMLALEQKARGHEVEVVALGPSTGSWIEAELGRAWIPVRFLDKGPGLDLRVVPRLARALRRARPDVIHTHLHVLKYVLPALPAAPRARLVHTVHNLADREVEPQSLRLQKLVFGRLVEPVAIGEAVAASMARVYGRPPRVTIPNGVPTARFHPPPGARAAVRAPLGLDDAVPVVLAAGRLNPQKNHALLLEAMAQPAVATLGAHLLLAGEGELHEALAARAAAADLAGRVHLLGVRADMPALFGAADVFALSSTWEGNPLVVMEAMSAGLPVVATAVGCVPELVRAGPGEGAPGLLVPPEGPAAFAGALAELLGSARARREAGEAAARRAREVFDVGVMTEAYLGVYRRLTGGRA